MKINKTHGAANQWYLFLTKLFTATWIFKNKFNCLLILENKTYEY